jgi:hypothetical protein
MKVVLSAATAVLAGTLTAGCVVVDSQGHIVREDKQFTLTGAPDLEVSTFDGSIEIHDGADNQVKVTIEKRGPTEEALRSLQVDAKQDGNHVTLSVLKPKGGDVFFGMHTTPTANLVITMPRRGNIVARSGDGSIRVTRVDGKIDLHTGDGSIRGNEVTGNVTARTGDGSIALDGLKGTLDLQTSDGSVTVSGKPQRVRLHTGDGSVTFRADAGTKMDDEWSLSTGDGSVVMYLPSDFDADLDASTGDGTVKSDLAVSGDDGDQDKAHERRSLRGRIGNGGKLLRIRTGDGSIRLRTQ